MKFLVNTCISSFLILFILVFATNAEENKKKFEERLKNMRPEVKDHIFSEIDDGDGVLDDEEREEVMKMMEEYRKNNQINADENKKKFEEKKKKKFEERLKNMRPEVKDHIFSEIDDGDGVLDDEEREEVMKMMRQHYKNNQ